MKKTDVIDLVLNFAKGQKVHIQTDEEDTTYINFLKDYCEFDIYVYVDGSSTVCRTYTRKEYKELNDVISLTEEDLEGLMKI